MTVDTTTLSIITAVGGTGLTVGGALWASLKTMYASQIKDHKTQITKLNKRTEDCEEDRKQLHARMNDQSERITGISMQLGRMQGLIERNHETDKFDNQAKP